VPSSACKRTTKAVQRALWGTQVAWQTCRRTEKDHCEFLDESRAHRCGRLTAPGYCTCPYAVFLPPATTHHVLSLPFLGNPPLLAVAEFDGKQGGGLGGMMRRRYCTFEVGVVTICRVNEIVGVAMAETRDKRGTGRERIQ